MTPELSVVVAAHGSAKQLAAWLDAVRPQIAERAATSVEVLVCHRAFAASCPDAASLRELCEASWIRAVPGGEDALVPQLWRDGIAAARAPRVALGVVECLPDAVWLAALLNADLQSYCAIGGAIDCDPAADEGRRIEAVVVHHPDFFGNPWAAFHGFDQFLGEQDLGRGKPSIAQLFQDVVGDDVPRAPRQMGFGFVGLRQDCLFRGYLVNANFYAHSRRLIDDTAEDHMLGINATPLAKIHFRTNPQRDVGRHSTLYEKFQRKENC